MGGGVIWMSGGGWKCYLSDWGEWGGRWRVFWMGGSGWDVICVNGGEWR